MVMNSGFKEKTLFSVPTIKKFHFVCIEKRRHNWTPYGYFTHICLIKNGNNLTINNTTVNIVANPEYIQ